MVKIQQLPNGQYVITLPKQLAILKGWEKGTEIVFKDHTKNSFVIEKKVKNGENNENKE